jgi:hypothetical protein
MYAIPVLTISFDQFETEITDLCNVVTALLKRDITSEDEYQAMVTETASLNAGAEALFDQSFSGKEFLIDYNNSFRGFVIPARPGFIKQPPLYEKAKKVKERVTSINGNLQYYLRLISACDLVRNKDADFSGRNRFTVQEQQFFLLKKLFDLDDGGYYDLNILWRGNGLTARSYAQIVEIADQMEKYGHIDTIGGSAAGISGRIAIDGRQFVERNAERSNGVSERITDKMKEMMENIKEMKRRGIEGNDA